MSARNTYSPEVTEAGEFTELVVERKLSDVDLARTHVIGRNRRVGQVLCYLSLMKSHGLIPQASGASAIAAIVQDFKSGDGNEAAHYLPGQLKLGIPGKGDVTPWSLVRNPTTAGAIASLFSAVQDLPANFNKADSYVEMYANPPLKKVFAQACAVVLAATPRPDGRADVDAIRAGYARWIADSLLSYRSAINRKIDIAELDDLPPPTAPALDADGTFEPHRFDPAVADLQERAVRKGTSGQSSSTVWDYSEQVRILGHYLRTSEGSTLSDTLIADTASAFRP